MKPAKYEKYISVFNKIRNASITKIRELSEAEAIEKDTYSYCVWGEGQSSSAVKPRNLELGLSNTVTLKNPATKTTGKDEVLANGSLNMIEHWAALPVLLQRPLSFKFATEYTPYCNDTMRDILTAVYQTPRLNKTLEYKTINEGFTYIEGDKSITIEPRKEPGLIIHGEFDFSEAEGLEWLGKQSEIYNSSTSNPFEYACSRAPDVNGFYSAISKSLGRPINKSCILTSSDIMKPNEVAKHKEFDIMAILNFGPFLFAGEIDIKKAGHKEHIEFAQRLLRERKLIKL